MRFTSCSITSLSLTGYSELCGEDLTSILALKNLRTVALSAIVAMNSAIANFLFAHPYLEKVRNFTHEQ
jgi:hypothetical protein